MKTYIYHDTLLKNSVHELKIYRIKNNIPVIIGICNYNAGCTVGRDSEVFQFLIKEKEIPESYFGLSKNDLCSGGYYCTEVEKRGIKIIEI